MVAETKLDPVFFERLAELLGSAESARVGETMTTPKRAAFWVNPLREGDVPEGAPVPGLDNVFSVPAALRDAMVHHAAAESGRIYPINPSSVLAVRALAVTQDQEVLDLAAAPGGKTLLLAAAMANTGRVAAVEPGKSRFHRLRANLERCGVRNAQLYLADGRGVGRKVPERFDRVLLDAPCSSEARIRLAYPDSFHHWSLRKVRQSAHKQRSLLKSAWTSLAPGGLLVYCTCAFAPEENELVVDALLRRAPDAILEAVEVPQGLSTIPGVDRWRGRELHPALIRTVRVLPDELWDGFFVARLRKPG